ncbi:MAG: YeeE/YedE family protein [Actinomycetota bacterium]|nr:YeeE/YedE family protein [Actinomycetota bacterium]
MLEDPPAWYVIGPLLGLIVVGVLATLNQRVGVLGGVSDFVERAIGRRPGLGWKAWFLIGVALGGTLFVALRGGSPLGDDYGWMTRELDGWVAALALMAGGVLIGFGAKSAGGCTAGNGLSGTSHGSPAAFVSMGTFMASAIVVSFAIEALV